MISELVAGSACTKPPVDGLPDGVTGAVACGELPGLEPLPDMASVLGRLAAPLAPNDDELFDELPDPPEPPL